MNKMELEQLQGTYRGFMPSDEAPGVNGLEITLTPEAIKSKCFSPSGVHKDEAPISMFESMTREELKTVYSEGSDYPERSVGFSAGGMKYVFLPDAKEGELGLIVRGNEMADILGGIYLFNPEQVADNLFDPDPYLQSGGDMVRVGGMDYTMDPLKPLYERITDARLDSGHLIEATETYRVAGWAQVNNTPDGRLMWDVVRDHIVKNKGKDDVLTIPKINHPKLIGVSDNPGIADYPGEIS